MKTFKVISTATLLPVREFEKKEDLLSYLSYSYVLSESGHNPNDSIIGNRSTIWHDSYYHEISDRTPINYLIKDEYDRTMDIYYLAEEIYALRDREEKERAKDRALGRSYYRYYYRKKSGKFLFEFRKDPVPGIHKRARRGYRKAKRGKREYTSLIIDKEVMNSRAIAKKKALVCSWGDEIYRTRSNSWKDQGKYLKQYKKHKK